MQRLFVDLHLHTVLSPCAEVEMIPPLIVRRALELGLDVIAITDHHGSANVRPVIDAAQGTGLVVLPGMEVQTREEVHVLCIFDELEQVEAWQETVWAALPDLLNREAYFGAQYAVDAEGAYLYTEHRLLATSMALSIEQVAEGVNALGGICLPAHVNRPSFSILGNLGFIPQGLPIAGLELDRLTAVQQFVELHPGLSRYGLIVNSDAHRLVEMGTRTSVCVASPAVSEIGLALAGQDGRCVRVCH